ncbi:MAG: ABC transporter substrate-binding protein, partial [Opitutales bacterium]
MSRCLFVLASFGCPRPVLGLLFAAALLTGCGRSEDAAIGGTATGLGPLTLRLAAAPGPAEGGFIQALAAGYYAAEGLAVEIVVGGGAADVIGAVAAGEADFGVAPSDLVLRAAAAGEALQLVGASHQPTAEELRKDGAGAPSAVW